MLVSWQQQHAALMQRYCVILYCGQSQCKCSDCTISDIFHHHCFLYFSSTAPLPPSSLCSSRASSNQVVPTQLVRNSQGTERHPQHCRSSGAYTSHQYCSRTFKNLRLALESTLWQDNMARCHPCQPETTPAAHPENHMPLILCQTSAFFFAFFLHLAVGFVFNEPRCGEVGLLCVCVYPVRCYSSSGSSAVQPSY